MVVGFEHKVRPKPTRVTEVFPMKIYDSFGPNPRALRMFLAEKAIDFPKVTVDLMGAENRQTPYTDKNPGGQLPALELDDGRVIAETVAIFEYLEEKYPTPALIGRTPEERAEARMWQRRVELKITEHLYNGFRFAEGVELFRPRMRVLPEAADGLKAPRQAVHRGRPLHGRGRHPVLRARLRGERESAARQRAHEPRGVEAAGRVAAERGGEPPPDERRHRHERLKTRARAPRGSVPACRRTTASPPQFP
jgi:glutathione S-transferase